MDLENQARIKELTDKYGKDDLIVVLGGAEAEASGLAAEIDLGAKCDGRQQRQQRVHLLRRPRHHAR